MDEKCTVCLSSGRKMHFIESTNCYQLYMQILAEIPVYDLEMCVRVCWECATMMKKFIRYKEIVKRSYKDLIQCIQQGTPKPIDIKSHLITQHNTPMSYPEAVKTEEDALAICDIVKSEFEISKDVLLPNNYNVNNRILTNERNVLDSDKVIYSSTGNGDILGSDTAISVSGGNKERFVSNDEVYHSALDGRFLNTDEHGMNNTSGNGEFVTTVSDLTGTQQPNVFTSSTFATNREFVSNGDELAEEGKFLSNKGTFLANVNNVLDVTYDGDDMHCEDTFVDDLIVDGVENQLETIKPKKKKKKKVKVKKLVISECVKKKIEQIESGNYVNEELLENIENDDHCAENEDVVEENKIEKTELINKKEKRIKSKEILDDKPTCAECGKVFSSKKTYRYHLNVLHRGQNKYPCPRCGKVYQWKSNLGRHLRTHKARDSGELYCELCDKRFASVATYRQHVKISRRHVSETEFSFMCNECGKKFVSKTRLRDHIDWDHLKRIKFTCQLCNKPFKCHTSLYVHMQNVHRNKEKKENLCHVCGKAYQNAAKLKYHIVAMHSGETPYRCGVCAAAFGWHSSLYRHIREVHYKIKLQPNKKNKKKLNEVSILPLAAPP